VLSNHVVAPLDTANSNQSAWPEARSVGEYESSIPRWGFIAVAVALFIAAAMVVFQAGRDTTFYWDEWDFIQKSRTGGWDTLLAPHNGHLSIIPILIYRAFFDVVGLRSYLPYRLVLIALHLMCCLLFYVLAVKRTGTVLALILTSMLLFLGNAWQDLLAPFQMSFLISIAAGLLALICIGNSTTIGNVATAILLLVSVASSGIGIPFIVAAGVWILARPAPLATIWVVVPVGILYVAWYFTHGVPQARISNLPYVPVHMLRSAAGAVGGVTGVGTDWGLILLVVGLTLVFVRLARTTLRPAMASFIVLAGAFWFLTGVTRGSLGDADANRYIYPGSIFVLLIVSEALAYSRIHPAVVTAVATMALFAIGANLVALSMGSNQLRASSATVRAELTAVEIARNVVRRDFQPDPLLLPQVSAGPYLDAVNALGSPAYSVATLEKSPEDLRAASDGVLERAEVIRLEGMSAAPKNGPAPSADQRIAFEQDGQSCLRLTIPASGATFTSPPRGIYLVSGDGSPIHVQLRRFADDFAVAAVPVDGSGPIYSLRLGFDDVSSAWHVKLLASGAIKVCGLGAT
jgi:hypothetical protein